MSAKICERCDEDLATCHIKCNEYKTTFHLCEDCRDAFFGAQASPLMLDPRDKIMAKRAAQ